MIKRQSFRELARYYWYPAVVDGVQWELYTLHKNDNRWLSKRNRIFFLNNSIGNNPNIWHLAKRNAIYPSKYSHSLLLCDHISKRSKYVVEIDEAFIPAQTTSSSTYKHLDGELKREDIVEFGSLQYRVEIKYLNCAWNDNDVIFKLLWIDKHKIATEAYGYSGWSGERPTSKDNDYAALSRLVDQLIDFIIIHPEVWKELQ